MKELAKKLSELVEKYIQVDNNELTKVSKDIENTLSELLLESGDLFTTILVTRFFLPIEEHIKKLELLPVEGRSRIYLKEQKLERLNLIFLFKNQILTTYQEQLKITEQYKENILEQNKERDFIINPYYPNYTIDIIPLNIFKGLLNESYENTIKHFKIQFETENNENYKNELFLFVDSTIYKISKVNKEITQLNINLSEIRKESNFYLLFQYQEELSKILFHKEILEKLLTRLYQAHFVLKSYEENRLVPLTVFGDRDYNKIEELYKGLKFLLEPSTTLSNIIELFTLESVPIYKINLVNGNLNDYALLITKMQPYFVQKIAHRSNYNQWWADRFLFNDVEKEKEDIARKRSAIKDDRQAQFIEKIKLLVQILDNNPQ